MSVGSLKEWLALFVQYEGRAMMVWMLQELSEGEIGLWAKQFTIAEGLYVTSPPTQQPSSCANC